MSPREYLENLMRVVELRLGQVQILRQDIDDVRAYIRFEASWHDYRVSVVEVYRQNQTRGYAYHVLDKQNQHIHRFDNSADKTALQLRYGAEAKMHVYAEIPHQHDQELQITLTPQAMTFELFMQWLELQIVHK